jgi:hypothetical protein
LEATLELNFKALLIFGIIIFAILVFRGLVRGKFGFEVPLIYIIIIEVLIQSNRRFQLFILCLLGNLSSKRRPGGDEGLGRSPWLDCMDGSFGWVDWTINASFKI